MLCEILKKKDASFIREGRDKKLSYAQVWLLFCEVFFQMQLLQIKVVLKSSYGECQNIINSFWLIK